MRALLLALAAAASFAGCRSEPVAAERSEPPAQAGPSNAAQAAPSKPAQATPPPAPAAVVPEPAPFALPPNWRDLTDLAFERAIDGWFPSGEARSCSAKDLSILEDALDGADATAVRAAVLLARTRDPQAGEILLKRLERRTQPPPGKPEADAADVVAAAAFAQGAPAGSAATRLASLGAGKRPHPDFAVRVECACSSVRLGRDEPIPYLLQVLRTSTTAGRTLSADERPEELTWAQARAAEALSARAGTEVKFLPEASVRDREKEAARLEALLPGAPEKKR